MPTQSLDLTTIAIVLLCWLGYSAIFRDSGEMLLLPFALFFIAVIVGVPAMLLFGFVSVLFGFVGWLTSFLF